MSDEGRARIEAALAARLEGLFADNLNFAVVCSWSLGMMPNESPYRALAAVVLDCLVAERVMIEGGEANDNDGRTIAK